MIWIKNSRRMLNCSIYFRRLTVTICHIVLLRLSLNTIAPTCHLIKPSTISLQSFPNLRIIRDYLKCHQLDLLLIDSIVKILVVAGEDETVDDVEFQFVEEEEVVVVVLEGNRSNPIFGLEYIKMIVIGIKIRQQL